MPVANVVGSGVLKIAPKVSPPYHRRLNQQLAAGAVVSNGVNMTELVNISNCAGFIIRILSTAAGTLFAQYAFPNAVVALPTGSGGSGGAIGYGIYATNQPASVAIVGGTENSLLVKADGSAGSYNGENWLVVQFQPSANGTLTWCDIAMMMRTF